MHDSLPTPFPILFDADGSVVARYGLTHAGGNPDGGETTIPAHFLVAPDGKVAYRFIAPRVQERSKLADDLAAVGALAAAKN